MIRGNRRYAPYPEFVDPGDTGYTVHDTREVRFHAEGGTDRENRRMITPFTEAGLMVARHELGHAKWSPKRVPERRGVVFQNCIRAVEDARINLGLLEKGVPFDPDLYLKADLLEYLGDSVDESKITSMILFCVAALGSSAEPEAVNMLTEATAKGNDWARYAMAQLWRVRRRLERGRIRSGGEVASFDHAVRIAYWLSKEMKSKDEDAAENSIHASYALKNWLSREIEVPEELDAPQERSHGSYMQACSKGGIYPFKPEQGKYYGATWSSVPPGEMRIELPPRTVNMISPKLEKLLKKRASNEGVVFAHPDRLVVDQRVFSRKRKKRAGGGSVLVDASGSMGLSEHDINKIVEAAPESTIVAVYAGDENEGVLKVIVAGGTRTYDTSTPYCGNVIDVPALEWLAFQPEPRVWYSDGAVTGTYDRFHPDIDRAVELLCADNNIKRCTTNNEIVDVMRRRRR